MMFFLLRSSMLTKLDLSIFGSKSRVSLRYLTSYNFVVVLQARKGQKNTYLPRIINSLQDSASEVVMNTQQFSDQKANLTFHQDCVVQSDCQQSADELVPPS